MENWWDSIRSFEQVFWYIAIPFSIILIIQIFLKLVNFNSSTSNTEKQTSIMVTENIKEDSGQSFQIFTLRSFISFFTVFGWSGILFIHSDLKLIFVILISVFLGFIAMLVISFLFHLTNKTLRGKEPK